MGEYFWQSEIAYELDKLADGYFVRRKAFIDGRVVWYDLMDSNFERGTDYYARSFPDLKFLGEGEIYEINGIKQGRFREMKVDKKYCVTIEDVYGVPFAALSAPQGYEFTGEFRPALSGEHFRNVINNSPQIANHDYGEPRLILRALPTVESVYDGQTLEQLKENAKTATWSGDRSLKFEWTGEFRKVQEGEYFLGARSGYDVTLNGLGLFTGAYRLIMRKCPTIKEIYGKELSELTPPKGYEFGEFRHLQKGDDWLSSVEFAVITWNFDYAGDYRLTLKKVTTVEGIYGAPLDKLTPPIGYRFTGEFRPPTAFEVYCTRSMEAYDVKGMPPQEARLILEKLPATPTIKDVYATDKPAIPKGWKMKEFRRIEDGEEVVWLAAFGTGIICNDTKGNPFRYEGRRYDVQKWRIVLEKEDEVVDLSKLTYPVTPEYIYGPTLPKVPPGYKVVGFRPPLRDELYLSVYGGSPEVAPAEFDRPRLILSPLGPR